MSQKISPFFKSFPLRATSQSVGKVRRLPFLSRKGEVRALLRLAAGGWVAQVEANREVEGGSKRSGSRIQSRSWIAGVSSDWQMVGGLHKWRKMLGGGLV